VSPIGIIQRKLNVVHDYPHFITGHEISMLQHTVVDNTSLHSYNLLQTML